MVRRWVPTVALALLAVAPAVAADEVDAARTLLGAWHEDPQRIDRARALLEGASEPSAATLTELAYAWFLTGDFRVRADAEKLAAYEHGMEAARRAIALAPRSEAAHLWYAINSGRWAEAKGIMRALATVGTVREESATVLQLNPASVDGLVLAGGIAAGLPAMMGGNRAKAETYFKHALELDPHRTNARLELAKLYLTLKRWSDARRELQRIVEESAPSDLPRWTVSDAPRARSLLAELGGRGVPVVTTGTMQSP